MAYNFQESKQMQQILEAAESLQGNPFGKITMLKSCDDAEQAHVLAQEFYGNMWQSNTREGEDIKKHTASLLSLGEVRLGPDDFEKFFGKSKD